MARLLSQFSVVPHCTHLTDICIGHRIEMEAKDDFMFIAKRANTPVGLGDCYKMIEPRQ